MRKIEEKMVNAVRNCKYFHEGNTEVVPTQGAVMVYLHGNMIYMINNGTQTFTLAGWNTPTTRSRLRALGVNVTTKAGKPIYEGEEISSVKLYHRIKK